MAHPPHASAVAAMQGSTDPDFEPHSEVTLAREVLRADGLNAIERSEREAALDENRAEEAAIFERAASRLRPSWSEADQMLDLGLANALPAVVEPASVTPSFTPPVAAPISFPAVVPSASVSATEITDGFPAVRARAGLLANRRALAIAAAVGCVALGGVWAAFSGGEPAPAPAAAPVVAAPAAVAPAIAAPAPVVPAPATPAPVNKAPARELTREEARALLGLPPEPVKTAKKPGVKAAAKPLKAAPVKAVPAKKPLAKRPAR